MKLNELTYSKTGTILNKNNKPLKNWEQLKELMGYKSLDRLMATAKDLIKFIVVKHESRTEYLLVAEQSLAGNKNRSDLQKYAFDGITEIRTRDKVDSDNSVDYIFFKLIKQLNESLEYQFNYTIIDRQIIDLETGEVVKDWNWIYDFIQRRINCSDDKVIFELVYALSPNQKAKYQQGPQTELLKSMLESGRKEGTRPRYIYDMINTLDLLDNYTPTNEDIFQVAEGKKITKEQMDYIKAELTKIAQSPKLVPAKEIEYTIKPNPEYDFDLTKQIEFLESNKQFGNVKLINQCIKQLKEINPNEYKLDIYHENMIQLDTDSSNLSHQTKTIKPMEGTQMITNITITKGSTINLNGFTVTRINNIRYEIAGIEGRLTKSEMLAIVNQPTELTPVIEPTESIQTTETINVPEVINEVPTTTETHTIDVPEQSEPDEFVFDSIKAIYTLSEMKQLIKSDKINLLQFMINYKRRVTTQTYEFFMDRQHRYWDEATGEVI